MEIPLAFATQVDPPADSAVSSGEISEQDLSFLPPAEDPPRLEGVEWETLTKEVAGRLLYAQFKNKKGAQRKWPDEIQEFLDEKPKTKEAPASCCSFLRKEFVQELQCLDRDPQHAGGQMTINYGLGHKVGFMREDRFCYMCSCWMKEQRPGPHIRGNKHKLMDAEARGKGKGQSGQRKRLRAVQAKYGNEEMLKRLAAGTVTHTTDAPPSPTPSKTTYSGQRNKEDSNPNKTHRYLGATHYCMQMQCVPSAEKEWKLLPEGWKDRAKKHCQTDGRKQGGVQRGVAQSLLKEITREEGLPAHSGDRNICCLSWSYPDDDESDHVDAILKVRKGSAEIVCAEPRNAWALHFKYPESNGRPVDQDSYLTTTNWLSDYEVSIADKDKLCMGCQCELKPGENCTGIRYGWTEQQPGELDEPEPVEIEPWDEPWEEGSPWEEGDIFIGTNAGICDVCAKTSWIEKNPGKRKLPDWMQACDDRIKRTKVS
eukprot:SAG25_NODE_8_length_29132_cov_108.213895_26_plen_484_part_00